MHLIAEAAFNVKSRAKRGIYIPFKNAISYSSFWGGNQPKAWPKKLRSHMDPSLRSGFQMEDSLGSLSEA
jgi:hypothetical protein